jgi:hypothetical protein
MLIQFKIKFHNKSSLTISLQTTFTPPSTATSILTTHVNHTTLYVLEEIDDAVRARREYPWLTGMENTGEDAGSSNDTVSLEHFQRYDQRIAHQITENKEETLH